MPVSDDLLLFLEALDKYHEEKNRIKGLSEKQSVAWIAVVRALRLKYLQGNSHIQHIDLDAWIDEQVVNAIEIIRKTAPSRKTATLVSRIEGRGFEPYPKCVSDSIPAD